GLADAGLADDGDDPAMSVVARVDTRALQPLELFGTANQRRVEPARVGGGAGHDVFDEPRVLEPLCAERVAHERVRLLADQAPAGRRLSLELRGDARGWPRDVQPLAPRGQDVHLA